MQSCLICLKNFGWQKRVYRLSFTLNLPKRTRSVSMRGLNMLILLIDRLFLVYMIMLFVRILGSWLPELNQYQFMLFIRYYTDPYLNFFRQFIPPLGMIDLSPIVAFLCLGVIEHFVKWLIISLLYWWNTYKYLFN